LRFPPSVLLSAFSLGESWPFEDSHIRVASPMKTVVVRRERWLCRSAADDGLQRATFAHGRGAHCHGKARCHGSSEDVRWRRGGRVSVT
jgi:hypothetical protein